MKPWRQQASAPLFEAEVWYDKVNQAELFRYVFLYRWTSPSGHTGIDAIYTNSYADFLTLLEWWNRRDWKYQEVADENYEG